MSELFISNQLKKISPEFGDRYVIEFQDILTKHLGPVMPKPKIVYEDGKIYEIYFDEPENLSDQSSGDSLEDISNDLKEKLKSSIEQLSAEKKNPNSQQALLILKAFDEKWLDVNNLTFSNDQVMLRCWGVKNRYMPKVNKIETISVGSTPNNVAVGVFAAVLLIIFFLYIKNCSDDYYVDKNIKEDKITNRKHDRSNVISKFSDVNSKLDLLQRKVDEVNIDKKDGKDSKKVEKGNIIEGFLTIHNKLNIKVVDKKGRPINDVLIYRDDYTTVSNSQGFTTMNFYKKGMFKINLKHKKYFQEEIIFFSNQNTGLISREVRMRKKNVFTKLKEFIFPSTRG